MSLSDLASIASLVSTFAVLISLIYLGLQVRQAEKNQQAAIRQGRATRAVDIILAAGDPALAEALPKGTAGEPASRRPSSASSTPSRRVPGERRRYVSAVQGRPARRNGVHELLRKLATDTRAARRACAVDDAPPRVRSGFAKFMDRLMGEAPKGAPADFLTAWKAEAAKEIAALHDPSKPK